MDGCHQNELTLFFFFFFWPFSFISPILDQIKRLQRSSSVKHEFSIFWVPRRTLVSDTILEEAGIIGDVSVSQFPLYFFPLEQDLLSLELEDSFGDLYLVRESWNPFFEISVVDDFC